MLVGSVADEVSQTSFSNFEVRNGIDSLTKDRYLRTLVRNTFSYHLNEIFATVQNEYTDWAAGAAGADRFQLQYQASRALTDRLYTAPIHQTAAWANETGFDCFLYVFTHAAEATRTGNKVSFN